VFRKYTVQILAEAMANMNEVLGNIPEDSENRDDITVCLKMFI
jgi:hypothetical protein